MAKRKKCPVKKCPVIVLCLIFAFSIFIVPFIIGIVLYIRNVKIDRERIRNQADLKSELEKSIDDLKTQQEQCQNEYNQICNEKEKYLKELTEKAKVESEKELESKLSAAKETLKHLESDIEVKELLLNEKSEEYEKGCKTIENNAVKVEKLKSLYKSLQYAIKAYENGSDSRLDEALVSATDEALSPIVEIKLNCMNVKQLKKRYNVVQQNIQDTFKKYEGRYNTKTNMAIYKLMVIALEAELQNVLYSLKYGKLEDSIESVKDITARYLTIAVDGNQSIAPTIKKFIGEIEFLFTEAIKIEYTYYTKKEQAKEEQRALKEQMKQEAAERIALEQQQKQVEKEESKYKNEIQSITEQLKTANEKKTAELEARIKELQEQLSAVNDKKEQIAKLQNGKAGYVYVISNLGSFGKDVFKVGMTRRLDPMDRVKELGDASVPFSFDVHSFIFSNDAPALETALHKELSQKRVNKINARKEFFYSSTDELEELVYKYQPTAEFNKTMLAEEYRQSLSISEELEDVSEEDEELITNSAV